MSNRLTRGTARAGEFRADSVVGTTGFVAATGGVYLGSSSLPLRRIYSFSISAPTGTTDTLSGITVPAGLVLDAWAKVTTAASGAHTLSVGLTGTTNGLLNLVGTSSTGIKVGSASLLSSGDTPIVASVTRGALLSASATGTTGDAYYSPLPSTALSTATAVTYSVSAASSLVATVYVDTLAL